MIRKNLAVLFVASLLVAASAVTAADAGVGGCRGFGCGGGGGWEAVQAPATQHGRADDVLSALSYFVPRPVLDSLRALVAPRNDRPTPVQAPTSPAPTTEGVGGCRLGCGGWL